MGIRGFGKCRKCNTLHPHEKIENRVCKDCRDGLSTRTCASCKRPYEKKAGTGVVCPSCERSKQTMSGYVHAKVHRCEAGHRITTRECVQCNTEKWIAQEKSLK
jgi:hypothetical protein